MGNTQSGSLGPINGAHHLMSVAGNMANTSRVEVYQTLLSPATLRVIAASGNTLRGDGGNVGPTTMTSELFYSNNSYTTTNPPVALASTSNPNTRCFLTKVNNVTGGGNFGNPNDQLIVYPSGGTW